MVDDLEYIAARRVLLDALAALNTHRKAVVLVGAQAIYHHVGSGDMAVAPYTTDGDLALNPSFLDDEPMLASALQAAGFELTIDPGTWSRSDVPIDFLVPSSLGGGGRRSARLGPHGNSVARKAKGLEAALVDNRIVRLAALESIDSRSFDVAIAGTAALLVAKLHKIAEREDSKKRSVAKDGLDVLRLLRGCDLSVMAKQLRMLEQHIIAKDTTKAARTFLRDFFGSRSGVGSKMAVQASRGLEDALSLAASCEVLAGRLLSFWQGRS